MYTGSYGRPLPTEEGQAAQSPPKQVGPTSIRATLLISAVSPMLTLFVYTCLVAFLPARYVAGMSADTFKVVSFLSSLPLAFCVVALLVRGRKRRMLAFVATGAFYLVICGFFFVALRSFYLDARMTVE